MASLRPHNTEKKVVAGAAGGGAGGVFSTCVLWLLGVTIWGAPATADAAVEAVAAVPVPVSGVVWLVTPALAAFGGGFWADHTPRPDRENDAQSRR